ncbi:MAG: hypothetical protein KME64_42910 [Scytonematopsis contorta HA4267-MV1]|jgi:hypothetical protein|nr:hypothetical protein [Scytonematopsis contorta HA4267-MV1]
MNVIITTARMKPRDYLRLHNWLYKLSSKQISVYESEKAYYSKCVKILSCILGIKERAVRRWGEVGDIDFPDMPSHHELTLGYAAALLQFKEVQE